MKKTTKPQSGKLHELLGGAKKGTLTISGDLKVYHRFEQDLGRLKRRATAILAIKELIDVDGEHRYETDGMLDDLVERLQSDVAAIEDVFDHIEHDLYWAEKDRAATAKVGEGKGGAR